MGWFDLFCSNSYYFFLTISITFTELSETRLDNVEESLRNADIEERLETLIEMKTIQNKWIAEYEKEIKRLEVEVTNIQAIANALPPGCFKRTHLEP